MARWIEATDAQRAQIVARAAKEQEAKRRAPTFQAGLIKVIAEIEAKIAAKQNELAAGGFARRLNRQIEDLQAELAFQKTELR
jgi:hypothetical protein